MDGCRIAIGLSTSRGREPRSKHEQRISIGETNRHANGFSPAPAPAEISIFAGVSLLLVRLLARTRKCSRARFAFKQARLFVSDDNCVLGCYCRLVVCLSWRRDWEEILVRGEMRADLPQFAPARFFPCNCDSKVACVLLQNRLLQS